MMMGYARCIHPKPYCLLQAAPTYAAPTTDPLLTFSLFDPFLFFTEEDEEDGEDEYPVTRYATSARSRERMRHTVENLRRIACAQCAGVSFRAGGRRKHGVLKGSVRVSQ